MSIGWKLFEASVNAIEYVLIYMLLKRTLDCSNDKRILIFCIGLLLSGITDLLNFFNVNASIVPIITGVCMVLYSLFCFKKTVTLRLIYGILPPLIFAVSNYIVSTIMIFVTPENATESLSPSTIRFEAMLLYVFINLVLFLIVSSIGNKKDKHLPIFQRVLMIALLIVGIAASSVIIHFSLIFSSTNSHIEILALATLLILIMAFGVSYLFYSTASVYQKNNEMQMAVQQAELVAEHNKQIVGTYETLRAWKHDINNHLRTIKTLADADNCISVVDYINKAEEGISTAMITVNTKHIAVDAIISNKLLAAKNAGITVKPLLMLPEILPIADIDMCSVLSNLFDNAIRAVSCLTDNTQKYIEFEIQQRGTMLSILMSNPSNGQYITDGQTLKSTKNNPELHGIGLKHITDIVNRNSGSISIEPESSCFTVNILLPLQIGG